VICSNSSSRQSSATKEAFAVASVLTSKEKQSETFEQQQFTEQMRLSSNESKTQQLNLQNESSRIDVIFISDGDSVDKDCDVASDHSRIKIGSKVYALKSGGNTHEWLPGRVWGINIVEQLKLKSYDIIFDDGERDVSVIESHVKGMLIMPEQRNWCCDGIVEKYNDNDALISN
jgi:hypothetical protein